MIKEKGNSTLEILIAFAVLILSMTAVIVVGFGNQSISVDTETNSEAIYRSKKLLEDARSRSNIDFYSVISSSQTATSGPLSYLEKLDILDISECKKIASSSVTWTGEHLRPQKIEFSTILTDIAGTFALGNDCDVEPPSEWDNPSSLTSVNITGQSNATGIDVKNNFVYLTTDPSAASKNDFFIYKFDPGVPSLVPKGKLDVSVGLNGVDVAGNYAYIANASTTSTLSSDEFVVIDISDPDNPQFKTSLSLGITPNCPNFCPGGAQTIYFYQDKVYIGTHRINGDELQIYGVSTPTSPSFLGSFNINHNINKIVVRGDYAYMATSDDSGELLIYDISVPSNISYKGSFDTPGSEDGTSLFLLGNKVYLARERTPSTRKDFYIIDVSSPDTPFEIGSKNLNLNPNTKVVGVVVRGNLAFLAIDDPNVGFQILDVSNPSSITNHTICTSYNFSENTSAVDMEGNYVFTANRSNAEIRVISDQPTSCS